MKMMNNNKKKKKKKKKKKQSDVSDFVRDVIYFILFYFLGKEKRRSTTENLNINLIIFLVSRVSFYFSFSLVDYRKIDSTSTSTSTSIAGA
jgi:hypothetical protein